MNRLDEAAFVFVFFFFHKKKEVCIGFIKERLLFIIIKKKKRQIPLFTFWMYSFIEHTDDCHP